MSDVNEETKKKFIEHQAGCFQCRIYPQHPCPTGKAILNPPAASGPEKKDG